MAKAPLARPLIILLMAAAAGGSNAQAIPDGLYEGTFRVDDTLMGPFRLEVRGTEVEGSWDATADGVQETTRFRATCDQAQGTISNGFVLGTDGKWDDFRFSGAVDGDCIRGALNLLEMDLHYPNGEYAYTTSAGFPDYDFEVRLVQPGEALPPGPTDTPLSTREAPPPVEKAAPPAPVSEPAPSAGGPGDSGEISDAAALVLGGAAIVGTGLLALGGWWLARMLRPPVAAVPPQAPSAPPQPMTYTPPPQTPPPPPAPTEADLVRKKLEHLAWRARSTGDPGLQVWVGKTTREVLLPDGRADLGKWAAANRALRESLTCYGESGEQPTWVAGDVVRATAGAGAGLVTQAAGVVGAAASTGAALWAAAVGPGGPGLATQGGQVVDAASTEPSGGGGGIIRGAVGAVLHPVATAERASAAVGNWAEANCPRIREEFNRNLAAGEYGRAATAAFAGFGFAACQAGKAVKAYVRDEVLPVDELKSLFSADTGAEERAWALAAGAAKIANILTLFVAPATRAATTWGAALERGAAPYLAGARNRGLSEAAAVAAERAAQIESRIAQVETLAQRQSAPGGLRSVADGMRRQIATARTEEAAARAAIEADTAMRSALTETTALGNFPQAQRFIQQNPQLQAALDGALRANNGSCALFRFRQSGLIGEEVHALMTANKLLRQDQVLNSTMRRIITEDVGARIANGQAVPRRYFGANATQGSRTSLTGANINVDLDFTTLGTDNVNRLRKCQILEEECAAAAMPRQCLDVNIYTPTSGLVDETAAAANGQAMLENILQTTGQSAHIPVLVRGNGEVVVGDLVRGQGREAVLYGRETMAARPGATRGPSLWEGHQGAPVQVAPQDLPGARATQVEGFMHALQRGDTNQMCKYANRLRTLGRDMPEDAVSLVRQVSGQKDPHVARQLMERAGIRTPQELAQFLGLPR